MAVKQTIPYNHGIFFITITCHRWIPLIEKTSSYDAVYNWFDHLKNKGHYIIGYTIMPNHLCTHWISKHGQKNQYYNWQWQTLYGLRNNNQAEGAK